MAQITIRNVDDAVLQALRRRAAAAGHSMEEEARRSLAIATGIDRDGTRAQLDAARAILSGHEDQDAEDLIREIRDQRARKISG